jgi:hypothetical protein
MMIAHRLYHDQIRHVRLGLHGSLAHPWTFLVLTWYGCAIAASLMLFKQQTNNTELRQKFLGGRVVHGPLRADGLVALSRAVGVEAFSEVHSPPGVHTIETAER